jgi:hypothetical protein
MFRNVGVFDRLHLALLLNNVPDAPFGLSGMRSAGPAATQGRPARRRRNGVSRASTAQSD